jgi:hypothetical protein
MGLYGRETKQAAKPAPKPVLIKPLKGWMKAAKKLTSQKLYGDPK